MKKLYSLFAIIFSSLGFSQVLLETNFDNYTIGNLAPSVGTIGTTTPDPGQGGWLALSSNPSLVDVNYFQIENNGVDNSQTMALQSHLSASNYIVKYLGDLWNERTAGNNIFKGTVKVFIGEKSTNNSTTRVQFVDETRNKVIAGFRVNSITNELIIIAHSGSSSTAFGNYNFKITEEGLILPPNAWYTFDITINFDTGKVNWKVPEVNVDMSMNAFSQEGTFGTFINGLDPIELTLLQSADGNNRKMKVDDVKFEALNPNLAVSDNIKRSFNIYPNPVKSELNITSESKIIKVEIFSSTGQKVLENKSNKLNVDTLSKGVYFLKVYYDNGTQTRKFIKK